MNLAIGERSAVGIYGIGLIILILMIASLYLINISDWLMHDDEGTDFYEVWRLQLGEKPGIDYAAEQQPLFLIVGSTLIGLFGRSALPLRLLSTIQIFLGTMMLAISVNTILGFRAAVITLGLVLLSGIVFEQGRLFRPDPMMLGWEMAGLGLALQAVNKGKKAFWALAGICYGIAFLWKLFGVLPVVGLVLYYLDWLIRERNRLRSVVVSGLFFAIPYLLIAGGLWSLLYTPFGFYYGEIFRQHANIGGQITIFQQLKNLIAAYLYIIVVNAVFILIIPLWIINRPKNWTKQPVLRLLMFQIISPLVFIFFDRTLFVRYLFFLLPVFAILLAWQIELMFQKLEKSGTNTRLVAPATILLLFVFMAVTTFPRLSLLLRSETGTLSLAEYVASHTEPDDVVISDYAGINFFSERPSIYEASLIAGGQIEGQVITGELLQQRIEDEDVKMVLIHVDGGEPPAHQLVRLVDYEAFRAYLLENFNLLTVFERAGQQIEVFKAR